MTSANNVESLYKRLVDALIQREPKPSRLTVIRSLVQEDPQVLQSQDDEGRTPLHHALAVRTLDTRFLVPIYERTSESHLPYEVIEYLVDKCPKSVEMVNNKQETPLHIACYNRAPLKITVLLLESYPEAGERRTICGLTPLPEACAAKGSVEIVRLLLETYPKAPRIIGILGPHYHFTEVACALHLACHHSDYVSVLQLLIEFYPPAAQMRGLARCTPLHQACKSNIDRPAIHYLASAWPVACLFGDDAGALPMDSRSLRQDTISYCLAPITKEAGYGCIDALMHPVSVRSSPRWGPFTSDTYDTIHANGMIRDEMISLLTIQELLKDKTVQTIIQEVYTASLINGFIKMNQAGRKAAVKDSADIMQGIAVCEAVSDHLGCLFAHLRENPSLCMRRVSQDNPNLSRDVLQQDDACHSDNELSRETAWKGP